MNTDQTLQLALDRLIVKRDVKTFAFDDASYHRREGYTSGIEEAIEILLAIQADENRPTTRE